MELHHITSLDDPLLKVVADDPVRPHISIADRVNDNAEILVLKSGDQILAATCMKWLPAIPFDEEELLSTFDPLKHVAVFYTIWSYSAGAGAELLNHASTWLMEEYRDIVHNIVTLSPLTEQARRFHMKNGATVYRENPTSVNYQYFTKGP